MIKLINKGILVYLFGSFYFTCRITPGVFCPTLLLTIWGTLMRYVLVPVYLNHFSVLLWFAQKSFQSSLFISPLARGYRGLSFIKLFIFPLFIYGRNKSLPLLWLALLILCLSFTLHLSLSFGLGSFRPAVCSLAQHPKEC